MKQIQESDDNLLEVSETDSIMDRYDKLLLIGLDKICKIATQESMNDRIVGLRKLRDTNDKDIIRAFFHYALSNMLSRSTWLMERSTQRGGMIFSICDEGYAILVMINNWDVYEKLANGEERTRGKLLKALFTNSKVESNDPKVTLKMLKGWSGKGVKEFNEITNYLLSVRNEDYVIEMENELMQEFNELDMEKTGKRKRDGNDEFILEDRVTPFDGYSTGFKQV